MLASAVFLSLILRNDVQIIPEGVRYKRVSDATNQRAVAVMKQFFATPRDRVDAAAISDQVVALGPGIWTDIKAAAPKSVQGAPNANFYVHGSSGVHMFNGRALYKPDQKAAFWKLLLKHYSVGRNPVVRKATSSEINYYWAWVPHDIQEPLVIVEAGKARLLFNLRNDGRALRVFTVDRIGVLGK